MPDNSKALAEAGERVGLQLMGIEEDILGAAPGKSAWDGGYGGTLDSPGAAGVAKPSPPRTAVRAGSPRYQAAAPPPSISALTPGMPPGVPEIGPAGPVPGQEIVEPKIDVEKATGELGAEVAMEEKTEKVKAALSISELYSGKKQYEKAIRYLDAALTQNPDDPFILEEKERLQALLEEGEALRDAPASQAPAQKSVQKPSQEPDSEAPPQQAAASPSEEKPKPAPAQRPALKLPKQPVVTKGFQGSAPVHAAPAEKKAEKETGATEGADKTPADMKAVREALYKAIKAASDIKDPYDRYYSFRSSAMDMWRAGDKGAAHNALRRAAESVPRIDSLSSKNSAYESIVSAWVEIGEMKQALSALANVRGRIERYNAYKTIARQQTKDGDMKAARETLATARGLFPIPPEQQKAWMDAFMAAVLTGAQDSAGAQALMDGIPQGPWRSRRLASIASTRLSGDDLTGAMETAGEITAPTVRYAAVNNIIANRIKAEDLPGTRKAIDLLQDPYVQGTWLMKLAGLRMAKGDTDGALALLSSIPVPREKVWALLVMGQGRLFAGDTATAKKLITAAAAVDGLTSPYWKAYALATAARGLNRAGDQSGASRLMARASREAGNVTDAKEKAWAAVWITGKRPSPGKDKGSSSASTETPKNEELADWIAMIDGSLDYPLYKGIKEYIQSLGEKDAEAMVSALASAAADLNKAMGKMQKKEAQWQAKRLHGPKAGP